MSSDAPSPEALASFDRDGFVVAPSLFTEDACRRFLERNRAYYAEGQWSGLDTHLRDDRFDAILCDAAMLAWARALLQDEVDCVQTLVFAKPPGNKGIAMHQESYYVATDPPRLLTAWVALEPADGDNGGLVLLPGSHRSALLPVREPIDEDEHVTMREPFPCVGRDGRRWTETLIAGEIAELPTTTPVTPSVPAGSVVFFDGRTIHGSARNADARRSRHAFSAHFVPRGTWVFREDIHATRPL